MSSGNEQCVSTTATSSSALIGLFFGGVVSVEEKVREEEEQDSDEFMNRAVAGCSGIVLVSSERDASNSCAFELYTNNSVNT